MSFKKVLALALSLSLFAGVIPAGGMLFASAAADYGTDYELREDSGASPLIQEWNAYYNESTSKLENGLKYASTNSNVVVTDHKNGATSTTSLSSQKEVDGAGTNSGRLYDGHFSSECAGAMRYAAQNGDEVVYYGNDDRYYSDITVTLTKSITSDTFYLEGHSKPALRPYRYNIYVSSNTSTLYNDANCIVKFTNTNKTQAQQFKIPAAKTFQYLGLRVYDPTCGHGEDADTKNPNNCYIRLWELGALSVRPSMRVYTNPDITVTSDNTFQAVSIEKEYENVLSGIIPTVKYTASGSTVTRANPTSGDVANLTDNNASTGVYYSNDDSVFAVDDNGITNGKAYYDLTFDAGVNFDYKYLAFNNHSNEPIRTGEYQIYLSESNSNLFDINNLVYGFRNTNKNTRQVFSYTGDSYISGRYVGIRVYNTVSDPNTNLGKGLRIHEIQLAGIKEEKYVDRSLWLTASDDNNTSIVKNHNTKVPSATTSVGVYKLNNTTKLSKIEVLGKNITDYKLYVAYSPKMVCRDENLVYEYNGTKTHQVYTVDENRTLEGKYIGIVANKGAEIDEIVCYGDEVKNKYSVKEYTAATLPDGTSLIAGKTPEMTYSRNFFPYFAQTKNFSHPANLTNGTGTFADTGTACFATYDSEDAKPYYYRNGEFSYDIAYTLDKPYMVTDIAIVNHSNSVLATGHYKLYVSLDRDTLFNDKNLVCDYVNENGNRSQIFTGSIAGKYVGMRIVDPFYDYSENLGTVTATDNYIYPRLDEIAVYGVSDNIMLSDYTIKGNVICGVEPGTYTDTVISKCFNDSKRISKGDSHLFGSKLVPTGAVFSYDNSTKQIAVNGDVNGDGRNTVTDIVKTINKIGSANDGSATWYACDCDGNDVINVTDIVKEVDLAFFGANPDNVQITYTKNELESVSVNPEDVREVDVECDNVVSENFVGFGANVFPSNSCEEAIYLRKNCNSVFDEFNAERYASMKLHYTRMWFQVDWMMTNRENDYIFTNDGYGSNYDVTGYLEMDPADEDFSNWGFGIYDFENQNMQSVYKMFDMLKDADTPVSLDFGWKCATRIWGWFNAYIDDREENTTLQTNMSRNSAPRDLDAYANACAALLDELVVKRGYDNLVALCFYNEANAGDFQLTHSTVASSSHEELIWWAEMYNKCYDAVKAKAKENGKSALDKIKFTATEETGISKYSGHDYADNLRSTVPDRIDAYAFHFYMNNDVREYYDVYDVMGFLADLYDKPVFTTETYGAQYYDYKNDSNAYKWLGWEYSWAANFIATANSGVKALLSWSAQGGYLPNPTNIDLSEGQNSSWLIPRSTSTLDAVHSQYYEQTLYTNYVPAGSDVLHTTGYGKDIRSTAFKTPSGDYTVVVEVDGTNTLVSKNSDGEYTYEKDYGNRTLRVNFSEKVGTVYMYEYNPAEIDEFIGGKDDGTFNNSKNANATVIRPFETRNVNDDHFSISTDGNYKVYVFSTMKPIKQIETTPQKSVIQSAVSQGATVNLAVNMLDCDPDDEVVWSITKAAKQNVAAKTTMSDSDIDINLNDITGMSIVSTSKTTASFTAGHYSEAFDVAVRASLKSDPKHVFAVILVRIKNS